MCTLVPNLANISMERYLANFSKLTKVKSSLYFAKVCKIIVQNLRITNILQKQCHTSLKKLLTLFHSFFRNLVFLSFKKDGNFPFSCPPPRSLRHNRIFLPGLVWPNLALSHLPHNGHLPQRGPPPVLAIQLDRLPHNWRLLFPPRLDDVFHLPIHHGCRSNPRILPDP